MSILVTGASGTIGRLLVEQLAREENEVLALTRGTPPASTAGNVRYRQVDIRSDVDWTELFHGVTTVYHLAWSSLPRSATENPTEDALVNIVGSVRLLTALKNLPGVRVIFASSGGTVYGPVDSLPIAEDQVTKPISAYGTSKLAVEHYLEFFAETFGLNPVSLRISNVFGPTQPFDRNFGAIATMIANAIRGDPIEVFGDGSAVRDYIYADDVVRALIAAKSHRDSRRVLNVGTGEGRSINEIIECIGLLSARPLDVRYKPSRKFDVRNSVLDVRAARAELKWVASVPFSEGVMMTYDGILSKIMYNNSVAE